MVDANPCSRCDNPLLPAFQTISQMLRGLPFTSLSDGIPNRSRGRGRWGVGGGGGEDPEWSCFLDTWCRGPGGLLCSWHQVRKTCVGWRDPTGPLCPPGQGPDLASLLLAC